jgi:hypothetical protein
MSSQKVVKDVICIIERDHPVISRKSCVVDILLWVPVDKAKKRSCGDLQAILAEHGRERVRQDNRRYSEVAKS